MVICFQNILKFNNFLYFQRFMSNITKKVRYDGRCKKRKWEDRVKSTDPNADNESKKICNSEERVKRRKFAMLLSYSGVDYFGMQRNPGVKTIEEDLLTALFKAKFITDDAFKQSQIIQFQRAARTDKGVSAARQVVSLKLPEAVNSESINEHLPESIRVFSIKRVTKGFNSKSQCDARTYIYILPTFSFSSDDNKVVESAITAYRASSNTLEKVNEVLNLFKGTKNFHNFTSRKLFSDPSAFRYIISCECEKPFLANGIEFATIKIKGQSFMLHQIRKMIGLMLAVVRGLTPKETIERAWTSERLDLPMAPGLGLVLYQVHYDRYNLRYGQDGVHDTLNWIDADANVQTFEENYIKPNIVKTELEEKSMLTWLETLPLHTFDVRDEERDKSNLEDVNDSQGSSNDAAESNDKSSTNENITKSIPEKCI